MFYRYHMQVRSTINTILKSRRLYQEWLCDMWSKIEGSRLKFIKNNQEQFKHNNKKMEMKVIKIKLMVVLDLV